MMKGIQSSSSMTYHPHRSADPQAILQEKRRKVKDPKASPELLDDYAFDADLYIKLKVLKHPNTSAKTLERLLADTNKRAPVLIAQHPNSTADILRRLVMNSDDVYVWRNVAWHPNVTPGTLEVLARKNDFVTLYGVLKNAKTSDDTLFMLAEHENEKVRRLAKERLRRLPVVPTKGNHSQAETGRYDRARKNSVFFN